TKACRAKRRSALQCFRGGRSRESHSANVTSRSPCSPERSTLELSKSHFFQTRRSAPRAERDQFPRLSRHQLHTRLPPQLLDKRFALILDSAPPNQESRLHLA